LRLTASLGVAAFPDDAREPEDLIRRADEAMYHVKASQRGGVYAAVSPKAPERSGSLTAEVSSEP
jgi:diguanylate cyclase (GGDEF)-like protein